MRIGILKTDALRKEFVDKYGEYPAMFERLLRQIDPDLNYATYDVQLNQYPDHIDDNEIYLITGSKNSVYDREDWIDNLCNFVRLLHSRKKPLIGVCFGHQLVAHALGGKAQKAAQGWQVGLKDVQLLPGAESAGIEGDTFKLISSHQDQVTEAAPGSVILASHEQCPVAMTRLDDHIFTVQGHPEFAADFARDLFTYREPILGEALSKQAIASLAEQSDGAKVLGWALNFLCAREVA